MVKADELRALALSLPEAEEKAHFEQPDFRVRNKIFAGLSPDGKLGTLKLSPDAQSVVVEAKPETYAPAAGAWGRSGWTRVTLAEADLPELRELVKESYRLVAPKTLARSLDAPTPAEEKPPARTRARRR
jgi:hypothetical protein